MAYSLYNIRVTHYGAHLSLAITSVLNIAKVIGRDGSKPSSALIGNIIGYCIEM